LKKLFMIALALQGGQACAEGIYTCVDAKGRVITADRPIIECLDRAQRELTRSGLLKRHIGPTLTAQEQALEEEKLKLAAEQRAREAEEKRRDRALLQRYPTRESHDLERAASIVLVDDILKAAGKRMRELFEQGKDIASEYEFYAKDPSRVPVLLKLRRQDNESSLLAQQKFMADQEQEKKRINQRFDEELFKLKPLWALRGAPASPAASLPVANGK
jgi:hypothetical protein